MTAIKPRSARINIYQGDDLQRLTELRRAADVAQRIADEAQRVADQPRTGPARVGDDDTRQADAQKAQADAQAARDEYDAFLDEAAERAVAVEVNALGRKKFRALMADHPPRKVDGEDGKQTIHEDDAAFDVNVDTFAEPFLAASVVEPQFDSKGELIEFIDTLSEGEFGSVFAQAYLLNRTPVADPQSSRYSSVLPSSDAI